MKLYELRVKDTKQEEVSLAEYKGKVLLIVNTATGCGFTPQYEGLENLYKKFKAQGFEVLDFPCNQFLNQAPGTDDEIVAFCKGKFGVTFKTFSKIDVNGKNADPLFKFLKKETKSGLLNSIKWNFTKFLVDREGNVIKRFAPNVEPKDIEKDIANLI